MVAISGHKAVSVSKFNKRWMMKKEAWLCFVVSVSVLGVVGQAQAAEVDKLSPAAQAGASQIAVCEACHAVSLDPPKGPPLYGIQRKYRMAYPEQQAFVAAITEFVSAPTEDKAVMKRAVRKLGLMPSMKLPSQQLSDVANYLFEKPFPPPCEHWEIAVKNAEASGHADNHIAQDKMKLERFCR